MLTREWVSALIVGLCAPEGNINLVEAILEVDEDIDQAQGACTLAVGKGLDNHVINKGGAVGGGANVVCLDEVVGDLSRVCSKGPALYTCNTTVYQ